MTFDDSKRLEKARQSAGMLMLSRKVGQRVLIGNDIVIVVNGVEGSTVTLGIQAPRHIPVDREEIRKFKEAKG